MSDKDLTKAINNVADCIVRSKRCVAFTGAGISTASGIPDFRSPGGIWDRFDPSEFTYQNFISNEEHRRLRWRMFKESTKTFRASPNAAHIALNDLEQLNKLECVITQNIDNLHRSAGNSKVIELHGNAMWVKCLDCSALFERDEIQKRLEAGEEIPECSACGGMLKSATISFGQAMPEKETREAFECSQSSDLFLVLGSSLAVQPAASMPVYAKQAGATLVIINLSSTTLDQLADIVINAQVTDILPPMVKRVREKLKSDN